jgi:hypothetical protein
VSDGPVFSARDLAHCASREVKQRTYVYPRLVYQGRLKAAEAERQIAMMQRIADDYEAKAKADELAERLL